MDFLNKAFAQITDLFRSMTPGARITSVLLITVVVISLGFLVKQQSGGLSDYLLGGQMFAANDVTAMAGALGGANLEFEIEGGRIRVPRGQQGVYLGALADAGALPTDFAAILQKSLDQGSFWMSKTQREAALKIATQKVLALAIRGMKGIENASVIYDIKTSRGLHPKTTATAQVTVKPTGSRELNEKQVSDIRHTVAGGIAQLSPGQVSVTDQNGRNYPAPGEDSIHNGGNKYYELVASQENYYRMKLLRQQSDIPGIKISVLVELDPMVRKRVDEMEWDQKRGSVIFTAEKTSETTKDTPIKSGRPGADPNTSFANNPTQLSGRPTTSSTSSDSDTEQKSTPGGTKTVEEFVGYQPKRVKVSVLVPRSHYEKVWRVQKNITDPEAKPTDVDIAPIEKLEKEKIQKSLVALIPIPNVPDPLKEITVETYTDYVNDRVPEPEMADTAMTWLGSYGSTLGMAFVGLFSLLMLRSMVRSSTPVASASATDSPLATNADGIDEVDNDETSEAKRKLKRRDAGGPSLREELTELVREDPTAAANILQSWIGISS